MPDSDPIFKVASNTYFIIHLFFRAAVILICVEAGRYLNDNPVGISIVFGIGLLIFLAIGDKEFHLYPEKIVVLRNSLLFIILGKRSYSYTIKDIKTADCIVEPNWSSERRSFFGSLYSETPRMSVTLQLELKNGKTENIGTGYTEDTIKLLAYKINLLLQQ